MKAIKLLCISLFSLSLAANAYAQSNFPDHVIQDLNMDGVVTVLAFGDSITRGVGDFIKVGEEVSTRLPPPQGEAGYPLRLESVLGISVENKGIPGEFLSDSGIFRFARTVANSAADYVVISEGANDTFLSATSFELRRDMQAMINMAKALGKEPMIVTIPTPCCGHAGSVPFVNSYNLQFRDLADINKVLFADVEEAFDITCTTNKCFLLNLPEGLHPNVKGYDAMAQTIMAAFLGIDILGPGGNILLAQALGVDPATIVVKSPPPVGGSAGSNSTP